MIQHLPKVEPLVVIVDIEPPVYQNCKLIGSIHSKQTNAKILVLTKISTSWAIRMMLSSGAAGILSKGAEPTEIYLAIKSVVTKGKYVSEWHLENQNAEANQLSDKELHFLQYCASDLTYKQIATELSLAPKTVDHYRERLFQKFSVKNRVALVLTAARTGVILL